MLNSFQVVFMKFLTFVSNKVSKLLFAFFYVRIFLSSKYKKIEGRASGLGLAVIFISKSVILMMIVLLVIRKYILPKKVNSLMRKNILTFCYSTYKDGIP